MRDGIRSVAIAEIDRDLCRSGIAPARDVADDADHADTLTEGESDAAGP